MRLLLVGMLVLGGCSLQVGGAPKVTASGKPVSLSAGTLVFALGTGSGLCPDGPCASSRKFYGDGRFEVGGDGGKIDVALVKRVAEEAAKADFKAIKSKPFKGTCPTAYDGAEFTYVFPRPGGTESLGTCQYDLDGEQPLFKAAWAAYEASERALHDASPHFVLSYTRRSGQCYPNDQCDKEYSLNFESDGSVFSQRTGVDGHVSGKVDVALVKALEAEMAKTDFKAIEAKPFTGDCPIAKGGEEDLYWFYTDNPYEGEPNVEKIAGCKIAVDPAHPLFMATAKAVAAAEQALAGASPHP